MEPMLICKKPGRIFHDIWLVHDNELNQDYALTLFVEDGEIVSSFSFAQGQEYNEMTFMGEGGIEAARVDTIMMIDSYPKRENLTVTHVTDINAEDPASALRAHQQRVLEVTLTPTQTPAPTLKDLN